MAILLQLSCTCSSFLSECFGTGGFTLTLLFLGNVLCGYDVISVAGILLNVL